MKNKKTAITFVDGQNLYYAARKAFGHEIPNYDIRKLSQAVCDMKGWQLASVNFYTGVPPSEQNASDHCLHWQAFWTRRLRAMRNDDINVFSRRMQLRPPPRAQQSKREFTLVEKGIDIRIALDATRAATEGTCDVIVIFSQDQDFSEVAKEVRRINEREDRNIQIASAYPLSPLSSNPRGINDTDWIKIDRALYDSCLDPRNYRPKV